MKFFLGRLFSTIFPLALLTLVAQSALAVDDPFREEARARLLALLNEPYKTERRFEGQYSSNAGRRFLEFYQRRIVPLRQHRSNFIWRITILEQLLQAGLHRDAEEKASWEASLRSYTRADHKISADPYRKATYAKWARLAEGLEGALADDARQSFGKPMTPNESVPDLNRLDEISRTIAEFFSNQSSSSYRLERGRRLEVAHGSILNEMAVLRSQVAKRMGYPTWAHYKISEFDIDPALQDPLRQREYLQQFIKWQLSRANDPNLVEVASPNLLLDLPADAQERVWRDVMQQSGFHDGQLARMVVDGELRREKDLVTNYCQSVAPRFARVLTLNRETLCYQSLDRDEDFFPGLQYISFRAARGYTGLRTVFHEGGHALSNLASRYDRKGRHYSSMTAETFAVLSEQFLKDPRILWDALTPRLWLWSKSISEVREVLAYRRAVDQRRELTSASSAIFDIDLWSYDYSAKGALTFLERLKQLHIESLARQGDDPDAIDPAERLSTGHYIKGRVRYAAYTFARMASNQLAEHISDQLERKTGRRDWYNQPELGAIMMEVFRAGWRLPFPRNIEAITGKPFALSCESLLDSH